MSGLNRLCVPDLGDQAHLQPLYQRRQADAVAWRDGYQRGLRDGKEGRRGGEMEGEKDGCRADVMWVKGHHTD